MYKVIWKVLRILIVNIQQEEGQEEEVWLNSTTVSTE